MSPANGRSTAPSVECQAMSSIDDIIEIYKKSVDRSLLIENLRKTPEQRLRDLQKLQQTAEELQRAGRESREK